MKSKNNASFVLRAIANSFVPGRCLLPLEFTIQRGLPLESVKCIILITAFITILVCMYVCTVFLFFYDKHKMTGVYVCMY